MSFYKSISMYYDHIFPFRSVQLKFVKESAGGDLSEKRILDIGCGTGNLTIRISEYCKKIIGIDLDSEMIKLALTKSEDIPNIIFKEHNMLDISKEYDSKSIDFILSFGNTLVHLENADEIENFLRQTKTLLKAKGKLFLQILNYDNILDHQLPKLPTIDNEHICFERFYKYPESKDRIEFKTKLTVKKENKTIENSLNLYPVRKAELNKLLKKAGYESVSFFGSFKREKLTEDSLPLVVEAW